MTFYGVTIKKTGFLIRCEAIPRRAAVDVLKAVRFRNNCTGCRQSFTRLHRGFLSLPCPFLGVVYDFMALRHISAWRTFDRWLHLSKSQWHKLTSVFLQSFLWGSLLHHAQVVPLFVFLLRAF